MSDNLIIIGEIGAPHGVRGEVRVIPMTDFPERFKKLKEVTFEDGTCLKIENVKYHQQYVLLKFIGLDNRNDIEHLRGKLIKVDRSEAVSLPKGHFYIYEIVGLDVYNENDEHLGKVTDVLQTGSNDVYVVEGEGAKQLLIPALKKVVKNIDIANGKMLVELQEEWE